MSLFGDQAVRLLRKFWPNAQMLAQELYAMMAGTDPLSTDAPLTLNGNGSVPPLTINTPRGSSVPALTFSQGDTPVGTISVQNGSLTFTDGKGAPQSGNTNTNTLLAAGGGGGMLPGVVVSGTGTTYLVTIYPLWPATGGSRNVTVTQLQIAASETIDAGTYVLVGKVGASYFMQSPVWGPSS